MVANRHRARWTNLLPLAALALLLPVQRASATSMERMPSRNQIRQYKLGLEAWDVALNKSDPDERLEMLRKAERRFENASDGPSKFPEARLSLALVRYSENNIIEAEPVFAEVAESTEGAMRAEALTYLGLISLRSHRWAAAKKAFEESMEEDLSDTTTSAGRKIREDFQEALRERLGRLDCVARVGSVLATFYMAQDPRSSPPTEADYRAVLEEVDRLLTAAGGKGEGKGEDMMAKCQSAFNGTDAAIWRFPSPPTDWRLNLLDGPPAGVRAISLMEFVQAMRVWAGAELSFEPEKGLDFSFLEGKEEFTNQERHNIAAGLLQRVLKLEAQGNFRDAFPIWERLSAFPETAMASRQHRIWILLHRPPGQTAPSMANINAARELIRGPLAADDPLLFEEQLALASALMYSATEPGEAMRKVWDQARAEYRVILNGFPGIPNRAAPEYVRRIAEWNLAVLAVAMPESTDPMYWERALSDFPALPGRERIRLYMAMRLAEAYMMAKQPQEVERALHLAEQIAAGEEGKGSLSVPDGQEQLRLFRRYLAKLAFQTNQADAFREGFLQRTDFGGEFRAWEAAEMFRTWVADLMAHPEHIVDAPSTWQAILKKLQDARTLTDSNTTLQQNLDRDISAVQAYLQALEATPPRVFYPWNEAANRTNTAKTPQEWDQAAQMWRGVLALLQGGSAADRAEAAMHVINAYMKKADVLFHAGDKDGAKAALDQARDALGVGPNGVGAYVTAADRDMTMKRIENNLKALGATETLVPNVQVRIPPYRGGQIGPCRARCTIIHYHERHTPDVADWLNRLQNNPDAIKRLVDWFNNGPMAKKTPDAKRDFSTDPNSPNYLVAFLSRNVARTPGPLARGAMQWCDHSGAGPWESYVVRANTAAYYLTNGTAIINADCSNPLAPIRVHVVRAEWMECPEAAASRALPQYPVINYGMPQAEFSYHAEGIFQPYALPLPFVVPVPIIPPAISVLSTPEVMPKLPLPGITYSDCGS